MELHEHLGDGWSESATTPSSIDASSHPEACTAIAEIDAAACATADLSNDSPEISRRACEDVGPGKCAYLSLIHI